MKYQKPCIHDFILANAKEISCSRTLSSIILHHCANKLYKNIE